MANNLTLAAYDKLDALCTENANPQPPVSEVKKHVFKHFYLHIARMLR